MPGVSLVSTPPLWAMLPALRQTLPTMRFAAREQGQLKRCRWSLTQVSVRVGTDPPFFVGTGEPGVLGLH